MALTDEGTDFNVSMPVAPAYGGGYGNNGGFGGMGGFGGRSSRCKGGVALDKTGRP